MEDGKIIIGCSIETKELQKDLAKAKKDLEKFANEEEKLVNKKAKLEIDLTKANNDFDKTITKIEEIETKMAKMEAANLPVNLETNEDYQKLINQRDILNAKTEEQAAKIKLVESNIEQNNQKIKENIANQSRLNEEIDEMERKLKLPKFSIDKIGNSINSVIKKVAKWTLALFGVRAVYGAIRQAMSIVSGYNDDINNKLNTMKTVIATALEPIITSIVNLLYKALTYINYISKAWFGVDLFAKAQENHLKGANKQAKQLKNSLAGFDEMNVVSDSNASTGGGGTNFDFVASEDVPIPSWLQWIVDNKDIVLGFLKEFGLTLAGIKIAEFINDLGLLGEGFSTLNEIVMGIGIGLILYGIYETIKGIVRFIQDPSWENFADILTGLTIILTGVALAMLAVNAANPVAWIILAIAAVVALVAAIIKYWDEIKEVLGKVWDWIDEHIITPIKEGFSKLWDKIKEIFSPVIDFFKNIFGTVWENIKIILDNIKQIFSALWDGIKKIFGPVVDFFKDIFSKAWQKIKDVFSPIVNFFSDIWNKVKSKLKQFGTKVGEVVGGAFKSVINGVLTAIENILNFPIKSINKLIDVINKIPGINLTTLKTFNLPRLAKGGIINQPGRGVPLGQAIGGEGGAEGVLPLTDSQQMELLGEAIGRYITINANITNLMNGRVISRELQKIQNASNFAENK